MGVGGGPYMYTYTHTCPNILNILNMLILIANDCLSPLNDIIACILAFMHVHVYIAYTPTYPIQVGYQIIRNRISVD